MNSTATRQPIVRHDQEGDATWFLNGLMTMKATSDETGGAYCLMEHLLTAASNPPPHIQHHEEEAFYVLDGEMEFEVDGSVVLARPGSFALVPRGAAHTFRVLSETARVLVITSGGAPNGGLEDFFQSAGVPARARRIPQPEAPDPVALTALAKSRGIDLLPLG